MNSNKLHLTVDWVLTAYLLYETLNVAIYTDNTELASAYFIAFVGWLLSSLRHTEDYYDEELRKLENSK